MRETDLYSQLIRTKEKSFSAEKNLIDEAQKILNNELISEKEILKNLKHYLELSEVIEEEAMDSEAIFDLDCIKKTATNLRLKFLDSKYYKSEIPFEAVFEIKKLNNSFHKDLKHFKILALPESFSKKGFDGNSILFATTNHNRFYKIYQWGKPIKKSRQFFVWPLKSLESLALSIVVFTLIVDLLLPTFLITLDRDASYWCGYRAGTFFHLLIFFSGFTAYSVITFAQNFSSNLWNRKNNLS